jgi:serine/threonine protein kinase
LYLILHLSTYLRFNSCLNDDYCIDDLIFHGGHGDVYRARHVKDNDILDLNSSYILKRMRIKDKPNILRCALREIYYGNLLKDSSNVATFYQHFVIDDDYWLVFKNEGMSLESMLYVVTYTDTSAIMESSSVCSLSIYLPIYLMYI